MIGFDEASHTYTWNGKPTPSVSAIIHPAYDFRFVKEDALIAARERGKKVHKTIELFESGDLVEETLHPFLAKHLLQWKRFKDDMKFVFLSGEQMVHSEQYDYCGTYDLYGLLGEDEFMPDIKTGEKYDAHKLQTAAYRLAAIENGVATKAVRRGSLYLNEDGYELTFHKRDNADTSAFLAHRTIKRWNDDNGK